MKTFVILALFVALAAAQTLDERRKMGEQDQRFNPSDVSPDDKEAIHEAVRLLSLQTHIDPKERTEILKDLMTGAIDFEEALRRGRKDGVPQLELDPKYAGKINEITERLKRRRSAHAEDYQQQREEMRARRKARMESRNEM